MSYIYDISSLRVNGLVVCKSLLDLKTYGFVTADKGHTL